MTDVWALPVFGTQNIATTGNVMIELDLLLCDSCNNDGVHRMYQCEHCRQQPAAGTTNFFEICMPSAIDTAFMPRFTELCNSSCEARLAPITAEEILNISPDGTVSGNLIVAICVVCEKKIIIPVSSVSCQQDMPRHLYSRMPSATTFPTLFLIRSESGILPKTAMMKMTAVMTVRRPSPLQRQTL